MKSISVSPESVHAVFLGERSAVTSYEELIRRVGASLMFRPEEFRELEQPRRDFSVKAVLEVAKKKGLLGLDRYPSGRDGALYRSEYGVYLYRDDPSLRYEGYIRLGRRFVFQIRADAALWRDELTEPFYDWVHSLAEISRMDFGFVQVQSRPIFRYDWATNRAIAMLRDIGGQSGPANFLDGPRGLALRSYFGEHFIKLFGEELLLTVPPPARCDVIRPGELVRIDLCERPWTADAKTAAASWRAAMAHLEPAGVFAIPQIRDGDTDALKRMVNYVRGPRYTRPPHDLGNT